MKSVLISTRPKWCERICHKIGKDENGKPIYEKRIEVRKSAPKGVPFKAYIYCTKEHANEIVLLKDYKNRFSFGDYRKADDHFYTIANGEVIGEFICDRIEMVNAKCSNYGIDLFYHDCLTDGCLTEREIEEYFNIPEDKDLRVMKGNGYVWHISDLKIYDKPKKLSEFERPCPYQGHCRSECQKGRFKNDGMLVCSNKIARPPQSYMFVEEVEQ